MALPNNDATHLTRLRDHYARYGTLPSYGGIRDLVGFGAKNAAVKLAKRLTDAGYLRSAPGGKVVPANRFFELPLTDIPIRAGSAEAIDTQVAAELVTLDRFLIDVPSKSVLIRVKGDSMRDAGVLDGDLAVVERTNTARHGEFVVAVVDDGFSLKELRFEGSRPVLVPHNREYAPIHPMGHLELFGVVRGIVRSYRARSPQRARRSSGIKI
jgi:repressor LexA